MKVNENKRASFRSPLHFVLILFLLKVVSSLSAADHSVSVSILSLLRPQKITLTLNSPVTEMLQSAYAEVPVLAGSPFEISSTEGVLQSSLGLKASYFNLKCPDSCDIRLQIAGHMDRRYTGGFKFYYNNNTIIIILKADAEAFTASIVASEMREAREPEALKAFAVVVRSFLIQGNRHPEKEADFCDTTHCQVFQNLEADSKILEAVRQTKPMVLSYRNHLFRPFYSRSCGGTTSTYQAAWGKPASDYIFPSVSCPCKNLDMRWQTVLLSSELSAIIGLQEPTLLRQNGSIVVSQGNLQKPYSLEGFRSKVGKTLGWTRLPGNHYQVIRAENGYHFEGNGQGHGVGFCQTGAALLAAKGLRFDAILSHYFPSTELKTIYR